MSIPVFAHSTITRDARGVYTLQISDAKGTMNILGAPVIQGLTQAVQWIGEQADARAMVLRGTGEKAFVAGANIHEMAALDDASGRAFITGLRGLCSAVYNLKVPTIARIPGYCLGGGLELAAACDIRLGSSAATFGMPEVRVGIPSVIQANLLAGLIGPGAANWLLLTGESVDAQQALQWGFLQFVCSPDELDALVEKTVKPITESAPKAVASQKELIRYWESASHEAGLDRSVVHFGQAFNTGEPQQYMAPFLNRKKG